MTQNKLILKKDQAIELIESRSLTEKFKMDDLTITLIEIPSVSDSDDWDVYYSGVIKVEETGYYYSLSYYVGATEHQDYNYYDTLDDEVECMEVYPRSVIRYFSKYELDKMNE